MKVNLNGDQIECTVEEYLELKGKKSEILDTKIAEKNAVEIPVIIRSPKKIDRENPRTFTKKHGYTSKNWSKEELNILKDNLHLSCREIQRLLPQRTLSAIYAKGYEKFNVSITNKKNNRKVLSSHLRWKSSEDKILRDNKELSLDEIQKLLPHRSIEAIKSRRKVKRYFSLPEGRKIASPPKDEDKRVARMKFISSRCKYLQNQNNWTREKALSQASMEWELKKRKLYSDEELSILPLSKLGQIGFIKMLEKEAPKAFTAENFYHLKLQQGYTWSPNTFEFMVEMVLKQTKLIKENVPKVHSIVYSNGKLVVA